MNTLKFKRVNITTLKMVFFLFGEYILFEFN